MMWFYRHCNGLVEGIEKPQSLQSDTIVGISHLQQRTAIYLMVQVDSRILKKVKLTGLHR